MKHALLQLTVKIGTLAFAASASAQEFQSLSVARPTVSRMAGAALALIVLVVGCSEPEQEVWMGYVYPDRQDLTRHDVVGSFGSLNRCLDAVREQAGLAGAYECGLNCRDEGTINVCERTVGNER